jgi:hypothetical protein
MMRGLMQVWPLTPNRIIEHAARWHGDREVVSGVRYWHLADIDAHAEHVRF